MCGHVGIAGALAYKDEITMKRLLLLDVFRGPDSTGMASIRMSEEVKIAKISSHPLDLFEFPRFKEALNGLTSKVFLGHNRAATRGVINTYNTHPFVYGDIVGAHNGTLDHSSTSALEAALDQRFPVDSQAIISGIEKLGIDDTVSMLQGAWALVWYDKSVGTINFLRNKERPFWYCFNKECDKLYWASEWQMLEAASNLAGDAMELYREPKTGHCFFPTTEDTLYSWNVEEIAKGGKHRPKAKARILKGKEPAPVAAHVPFQRASGNDGVTTLITPSTNSTTTSRSSAEKTIITLLGSPDDPFGGYFDKAKFNSMTKHGCSYCKEPMEFGQKGILVFDRDDVILCPKCALGGDTGVTRILVKDFEGLA